MVTYSDSASEKVRMNAQGRIVIPKKFRDALGLKPGGEITLTLDENGLHFQTFGMLLEQARAQISGRYPEGVSLVDDLIRERRRQGEEERTEFEQ